ncbi:MAG TPA: phosphopantetheine-binding protein [Chryseolinea sp.]|nr:phosphopantetheine-binding protein [Chryseolinea sp.]HPH45740.1 phosphopantetheine-binding protein [Chryseolinea sp.]HPM30273.1 phosphopantetheine-binding protein [Chryseolinea sp.]
MDQLINNLKKEIVETLNLKHIKPEEIGDDQPLFEGGLGLDSIDALELIVLLQQSYKIKIANPQDGPEIFKSVKSIAMFIKAHQPA